ncbi:conserved protein, unknown function [Plasmodium malariae]|uniref:CWC16 domain-containing protein n=1 Tax=Plasmodium malariae TaxID=5858 RepID=A0A1C3KY97_PLAMA|nr:conserved protein, unknown function [Plasmodium malariae]
MAERKVLNKYIPPDFDPDKLMESKKLMKKIEKRNNKNNKYNKNKKKFLNIRMMYPFTLKCNKCKSFTYVGTKFNSRVEKLKDESYLNIPIWKFYGKCNECKNEIIFKTDPKNGDYVLIAGGIRTYDAHKEQEIADDYYRTNNNATHDKMKNTEKESYNAMLELKTNEQLEELQNINKRNIDKFSSINKALDKLYEKSEIQNSENNYYMNYLDPEDEKAFFNMLSKTRSSAEQNAEGTKINQVNAYNTPNVKDDNIIIEEEELAEEEDVEGGKEEEEKEKEKEKEVKNDLEKDKDNAKEKAKGNEVEEKGGKRFTENTFKDSLFSKKKDFVKSLKQSGGNGEGIKTNINLNPLENVKSNREGKINNDDVIERDNNNLKRNNNNQNNNVSDINSRHVLKMKNLETNYNFIIKKKEDLSSIFNEYNSDSFDSPES